MDAPKHIWAEQSGYYKRDGIYYNRGRWSDDEASGLQPFVRLDCHNAALDAARVEAWNAAIKAAADEADEHKHFVNGAECCGDCIRKMTRPLP